jgi:hypothetical protein
MNITVFSGVFDPVKTNWLALPSGNTILASGEKPSSLVERYGGHNDVNEQFGQLSGADTSKTLGFLLFYDSRTDMSISWNCGSINFVNYQNRAVPEEFRQSIIDTIRASTGLNVKSR